MLEKELEETKKSLHKLEKEHSDILNQNRQFESKLALSEMQT